MKNISIFFKENNLKNEVRKIALSDRFKDEEGEIVEFEIQPLNPVEFTKLKDNKTQVKVRNDGTAYPKMDTIEITKELISKCILYPNLNDVELQNSYGVMGALNLATEILTIKEFNTLVDYLWEIHGEKADLKIEDVKK